MGFSVNRPIIGWILNLTRSQNWFSASIWNSRLEKDLRFLFRFKNWLRRIFQLRSHNCINFKSISNSINILNAAILFKFLANTLLNVCCGLGDLGCISFILWGFKDRECIFEFCEIIVGARMHGHFEGISGVVGRGEVLQNQILNLCTHKLF